MLIGVVLCDATRLPLRAGVVDRTVGDLPFGKCCGSRSESGQFHPLFFAECARVLRRVAGTKNQNSLGSTASRAVVMSADRGSLKRGAESMKCLLGQNHANGEPGFGLQVRAEHHVNMGGLNAVVLVLGHPEI